MDENSSSRSMRIYTIRDKKYLNEKDYYVLPVVAEKVRTRVEIINGFSGSVRETSRRGGRDRVSVIVDDDLDLFALLERLDLLMGFLGEPLTSLGVINIKLVRVG